MNFIKRIARVSLAACGLLLAACPVELPTYPGSYHACEVRPFSTSWPPNSNFTIDKPTKCPVALLSSGSSVTYALDGTMPIFLTGQYIRNAIYNAYGYYEGDITSATWGTSGNDRTVTVSGSYLAATAGFPLPVSTDTAAIYIFYNGDQRRANGLLDYYFGPPQSSRIIAPSGLMPNTNFDVEGQLNDPEAVGPITYSWYRNGVNMRINSPTFTGDSGAMGTVQDFQLETYDQGNDHTTVSYATVRTKNCDTPGCSDQ